MSLSKSGERFEYLSKDFSFCLKGYLALMILISHLYQFSGLFLGSYFGSFLNLFGHYGVVGFIFLSGFGLFSSYMSKGREYIEKFPKRRFLPFYHTYVFAIIIYSIYELIIKSGAVNGITLLKSLTFGGTVVSFGWYLQYTVWLYLGFFAIYVIKCSDKLKSILVLIASLSFVIISYLNHNVMIRYSIVLVFAFGFFGAFYKEKITAFLEKFWHVSIVISVGILLLEYKISVQDSIGDFVKLLFSLLGDLAFVLTILSILFLSSCKCKGVIVNPVSRFLGKYSLEIYIIQALVLRIMVTKITNPWVFSGVSTVIIILLSIPLSYLVKLINKPFKE